MRKPLLAALTALMLVAAAPLAAVGTAFPQLLPAAGEFELTLREDAASKLALGPACEGAAAMTLACRAFVVTLRNVGQHTVRLSRIRCQEPVVTFEMKEPNSNSGWWPISQVERPRCEPWSYENIRLRPSQSTEYRTRLVAANRPAGSVAPVVARAYTVRARWMLWGCTENPVGVDCLAPLQVMKGNSWGGPPTGDVEFQDPVEAVSREITVSSPVLPDPGPLKVAVEASLAPQADADAMRKRAKDHCAGGDATSVECTVFRLTFRNEGDRPIRLGRFGCSDSSVAPEVRDDGGVWKSLPVGQRPWACTANVFFETPIMPGKTVDRDILLWYLAPGFDTSGLDAAGEYRLRFRFSASLNDTHFCFASADGSFSLQCPVQQPELVTNEVLVHAGAYARLLRNATQ